MFDRLKLEAENKRLKKEVNKKENRESSIIKGKLLSTPKATIGKVNIIEHLKNQTKEREEYEEAPKVELNQDKRSLFFHDEFIKEKNRGSKWLS
jgi:uncharacterized membrane protein